MNRIFCSTGAIIGRPNGRDLSLLHGAVKKLHCDGFELMMYDTWYDKPNWMDDCMRDAAAYTPIFHVEKDVGTLISKNGARDTERAIELFEINCTLAKKYGASLLVLHLWG